MKEVHPYLSHVTLYMNVAYAHFYFLSLKSQKKEANFHVTFMYGIMRDYKEIFSGEYWYVSMDDTFMIIFFTSICIERRSIW